MKKKAFILVLLFLTFGFYSFVMVEYTITSILKQLDMTEDNAKDYAWSNIHYGNYYYPAPKALKKTSDSERSAIIKVVGEFVKAYTKTNEFAARYKEDLAQRKPVPPQKPETMAETRKKQKEQYAKSISEMEVNKKKMAADQQAIFDNVIKTMKEELKKMDDPQYTSTDSDADKYMQAQYEEQMKDYNDKLAQWEKDYNGSPDGLIKKWLSEFLEQTKDVDFNAALKEEYGRKKFVNPDYESKPHIWKLCFRAGKSVTETARSFAKSWQGEMK